MRIKNLARGFVSAVVLWSGVAQAAPLKLQMEGVWFMQEEYIGSGVIGVPMTVPAAFSAIIVFDPDLAADWGANPPKEYLTGFGATSISSSVITNALQNPFGMTGPGSNFTAITRADLSTDPLRPAPFEYYQFSSGNYSTQYSADNTMQYWSSSFAFYSGNSSVAPEDIHHVTGDAFTEILREAVSTKRPFYTYFGSYTFETEIPGLPPVTYTEGIGLNGFARIASISYVETITEVPEPGSLALLSLALGGMAVSRRSRST